MGEPRVGMSFGTYETKCKELAVKNRIENSSQVNHFEEGTYAQSNRSFYDKKSGGYKAFALKGVKNTPSLQTNAYASLITKNGLEDDLWYMGNNLRYPTLNTGAKVPNLFGNNAYFDNTDVKFTRIIGETTAAVDLNGNGIVDEGEIIPREKLGEMRFDTEI